MHFNELMRGLRGIDPAQAIPAAQPAADRDEEARPPSQDEDFADRRAAAASWMHQPFGAPKRLPRPKEGETT